MNEAAHSPYLARFESFEVNLRSGELRKNEERIRLPEQSFQILAMLLERPGEVVTRQEIQQKLWPNDTVVEFENSINAAIKRLRVALGDSADQPRYIDTLARRGYRWKTPVEWTEPSPAEAQPFVAPTVESPRDSSVSHLLGKRVSHYRVLEILGGGSMGVVYKAEDLKLGRRVALKFLSEEFTHDAGAMERFQREARAASALNHPNICTIYEIEEHDGRPFIVMELLEGRTLRDRLSMATSGAEALSVEQVLKVALQISQGLEAAHEKGIIHRDVKPANLFLTNRGVIKILDFGVAKLLELGAATDDAGRLEVPIEGDAAAASNLTQIGQHLGTAAYMSPEQVRGEPLDQRTDLFSFGVTLYEMATGRRAFTGDTPESLYETILNHTPTPPTKLNPDLPVAVQDVIQKCLQRDRKLRYQRAGEIRSDLEKIERETLQPYVRRHWKLMATAAFVVVALIAGGMYWHSRRPVALGQKDTIVLADFINTTGDPVFDYTLRQGLSAQLEQSPFLNLLSDERIAQTLSLMSRPKDARLTSDLAHDVCARTSSAATIVGSISSLGIQYVLGLRAVNCHSGDLLAEEQMTANAKEKVLRALGEAATKMRQKLGESLASVEKYDTLPENVTTPSLEALQAYSLGCRAMNVKYDPAGAIPFFQRAISLDPHFAMAYARLGTNYGNLEESARAAENMRQAYELRERVSEREKFYIESHYEHFVTGDLEATRKIYELWEQTYPRDPIPPYNLGVIYLVLGQLDKGLAAQQQELKLAPGSSVDYANLAGAYLVLNRLDEARATAWEAQAHDLDSPLIRLWLYQVDFLRHDSAGMEREAAAVMGKPGYEDTMFYYDSDTAAFGGQFVKARGLTQRAADSAQRADEKEPAAEYEAEDAVREVLVGNVRVAKEQAQAALALSHGRDVEAITALAMGLAGNITQAVRLANDLHKRFPKDSRVQFHYLPMIHAAAVLGGSIPGRDKASEDAEKAIEALTPNVPYELAALALTLNFNLYPVYFRGEAYLGARQGAAAAAEFQKIIDHPGLVANEPIGALAHLGLGRAYELETATDPAARDRARGAYQHFLTLWREADPDIPVYKEARAEYARLQ